MDDITFCGETNFRNQKRRFGIKAVDRRKHMYIIGKTGMGKTTLLENMAIQDIRAGKGVGVVDPHGEFAERMLDFVPEERLHDVVYFNPADLDYPVAFNSMEHVLPEQRHLIASGLLGVFKKIWPDVWSPRMEYLLSNAILALLEIPGSTLLGINRMFADKEFRKSIVSQLTDPVVRAFWEKEYAQYQERFATEAAAAIQNKVGQFISNPLIRNIVGQEHSAVDMRKAMDDGKIFIMNLSKGKIGEENSRLLGAMLVTKLYLTAMTRVDIPEEARRDFYLYVDEFQNFATESFANILSEARKYRLSLILAHQYITQMDEKVADAVFGNVGTMITFRVGAQDAEILEKEFSPEFMIPDLVNIGFAQVYLKLMIDGIASRPFSAMTLGPFSRPDKSYREEIIAWSRKQFGSKASEVKEKIAKFHGLVFGDRTPADGVRRAVIAPVVSEKRGDVRKLYETHCIVDGKPVMVPFIPDGKRPVYCEQHLEMFKKGELSGERQGAQSGFRRSFPREQTRPLAPRPLRAERHIESRPTVRNEGGAKPISLKSLEPKTSYTHEGGGQNQEGTKKGILPEERQGKKEVNLPELRKILEESLKRAPEEEKSEGEKKVDDKESAARRPFNKGGAIEPGERITFE